MRVTPKDRNEWRRWLEENHTTKSEIWLVFLEKTTRDPNLSYNDAVEEALCFGWIDRSKRSIDEERDTHRFTPRKPGSKWSASNKERARRMIKAGKTAPAGRQAIGHARKSGAWADPAGSRTTVAMPPELSQKLKKDRKAAAFFNELAPSYQRQYMAWIEAAKRPETRARRVDEAIALPGRGQKPGMRRDSCRWCLKSRR